MTFADFESWIKSRLGADALTWISKKVIGTANNNEYTSYLGTVLCTAAGVSVHGRRAIKYEYKQATDDVIVTCAGSDPVFDPLGVASGPDPLPVLAIAFAKANGFAAAVVEAVIEYNASVVIKAYKQVDAQTCNEIRAVVFRKPDTTLDHRKIV